jgi:hypothetical protein
MASPAASWLNSSTVRCPSVVSKAEVTPHLWSFSLQSVNAIPARECRTGGRLQLKHSSQSGKGGRRLPVLRSSSSSFSVEEEEAMEDGSFEGSPEGFNIGGQSRDDVMKEVMQRLSEEDLEEAAKKYKYEDEIFSQIDFAQVDLLQYSMVH